MAVAGTVAAPVAVQAGADEIYASARIGVNYTETGNGVGLFGDSYGFEAMDGLSPTHLEFLRATEEKKHRLIFVKGAEDAGRDLKMAALIEEAAGQVIRRRFVSLAELVTGVYASLVDYLADKELLRFGPFDATLCRDTTLADLSEDKILWFLKRARASRNGSTTTAG